MSQKTRIENLPHAMRDRAEELLEAGVTEQQTAETLNIEILASGGPLAEEIKSQPITQKNVNRWKHTEYAARQAGRKITKYLMETAKNQEREEQIQNIIAWLTAKLATEIIVLNESTNPPEQQRKRLAELINSTATLAKTANDIQWVNEEKRRVDIGERRYKMQLGIETEKLREKEQKRQQDTGSEAETKKYINGAKQIVEQMMADVRQHTLPSRRKEDQPVAP